jgi:Uma2 family endonuclease
MRRVRKERGAEPDECYVVGPLRGRKSPRPDLAIEVIWTSGGLDKLEIYSGLGVRELWICRTHEKKLAVEVLALRSGHYVTARRSRVLPALDLDLLTRFLDADSQTQAVRAFRAALRRRRAAVPGVH